MLSLKKDFLSERSEVRSEDFIGTWKNELGSTMVIEGIESDRIKGSYKTKVGQPGDEEQFELIGFTSGDLITFTVNFGKYGSLTSWTGQLTLEDRKAKIKTLWHLAVDINDEEEPDKMWSAIWSGADNFFRVH